jgi:hypothetical protein
MKQQQVSDNKEKSIAENLIMLTLIGSLMATFIYYFFKHEQHLTRVGFDSVANTFSARVMGIHAQWFMDNKPRWVITKESSAFNANQNNNRIEVNKAGWVDVLSANKESNNNYCQKIWQQVLATPMVYIKQPIAAVMVKINTNEIEKQQITLCQYGLPSGEYFEYQPSNGKVSKIKAH